jgi:opacity protein-like surface antigen
MASGDLKARWLSLSLLAVMSLCLTFGEAHAVGKAELYVHRMSPYNKVARETSKSNWGGGARVVVPIPQVSNLIAGTFGLEYTDMRSTTNVRYDPDTMLRVEEQANQGIFRISLGGEIGPHGRGFLRPHAGMAGCVFIYSVSTDIVIPNDADPENEVRQHYDSDSKAVMGWEATLGLDLNFSDTVCLDGGVRYLRSFSAPQQLRGALETIYPDYFQAYLAVGVSFAVAKKNK